MVRLTVRGGTVPQNRAVGAQFRFQADLSIKKRSVRLPKRGASRTISKLTKCICAKKN